MSYVDNLGYSHPNACSGRRNAFADSVGGLSFGPNIGKRFLREIEFRIESTFKIWLHYKYIYLLIL